MATDYNNKMILQPTTQVLSLDNSNNPVTYTEVWKGLWADIKDVFKTQKVKGFTIIIGVKRPNFEADANWITEYSAPKIQDDTKYPWVITKIDIQEGVGDYGTLTLTYNAGTPEYTAGDDGKSDPEKVDVDPDTSESTVWNITWGEYNRSMLDYSNIADKQIKMKQFPTSEPWWYFEDSTEEQKTKFPEDEKERKIQAYYAKDVSPRFHYPVITRRYEKQMPGWQAGQVLGGDIDQIVNLPNECPFILTKDWNWIQVSDNSTWQKSKTESIVVTNEETGETELKVVTIFTLVRETSWQGALIWDENFYGPNAWQPVDPSNTNINN